MAEPLSPTLWQQLSQRTLSVATIRQIDQIAIDEFHMHSLVLMENAAAACARWLISARQDQPRAVLLCGRGNNGGDGLAIMRHLQLAHWDCTAIVLGPLERLSSDALANWNILAADPKVRQRLIIGDEDQPPAAIARQWMDRADVIIDAMLGSGAVGQPRRPLSTWIDNANASTAAWRVAIDIPTGLDAETGEPASTCFHAHATLTFVARKPGFNIPAAHQVLGQIEVMPIGIPQSLVERLLLNNLAAVR